MLIDAFLIVMLTALGWVVLRLQVNLQLARVALQAVEDRLHDIERSRRSSEAAPSNPGQPYDAQVFHQR